MANCYDRIADLLSEIGSTCARILSHYLGSKWCFRSKIIVLEDHLVSPFVVLHAGQLRE